MDQKFVMGSVSSFKGSRRYSHTRANRPAVVGAAGALLSVWMAVTASSGGVGDDDALPTTVSTVSFSGSTLVSMLPPGFQPGLIYQKFPEEEFVEPGVPWQLGFAVSLPGAPATIQVMLRLATRAPGSDIQIIDDTATFVPHDGLYQNFDPVERFELSYAGSDDPYLGPIDFVLEPAGFPEIQIRVHLNVTVQPGFPVPSHGLTSATTPIGNIVGDSKLEILVPGQVGGTAGLFALDHTGNVLSGWPLDSNDPSLSNEGYATPNLVDLDGDGFEEIVVIGSATREVQAQGAERGSVSVKSLTVAEGSGAIRWRIEGEFETFSIPAVADLDGNGEPDIVISGSTNLKRFKSDGTPVAGWQVATSEDIHVYSPVIADVDGDPGNGLEIVGCASVFGPQEPEQVYVWNQDGLLHGPAWPIDIDGDCSAVAVVDLDSNPENGLEIVMGIDYFGDPPVDPKTGFLNTWSVFAWHSDGSDVTGWPHRYLRDPNVGLVDDRVFTGATAGDLDGNGDIEVVIGTYGQGDPANGNLFVFHHDGMLDSNWPRWAGIAQTPSKWGGTALGDLDGDGLPEIVTASFKGVYVFRGNGEYFEGFPRLSTDNFSQPMIADLDADGRLELVAASVGDGLFAWQLSNQVEVLRPWPRFRQNPGNTGTLPSIPIAEAPTWNERGSRVALAVMLCAGVWSIHRRRVRPAF